MLKILVITFLALAIVVGSAAAQTSTTTTAQPTTTTQSTTPTSNPNEGAFNKLSPGNQKIAQALYDAQQTNAQPSGSTSTAPKTYALDDIAAMKQSGQGGWGKIFKQMKADGHFPDAKNLGQVVSGKYQPQSGTSGSTTITSGSGKSQVTGKSGKGRFDDGASAGTKGSSGVSSGSGKGYGHGSSSGPSASAGGGGNSGQGGGKSK